MFERSKTFSFIFASFLICLIILFPEISSKSVAQGIVLSANVVIPALFPFMICVLILIKNDITTQKHTVNKLLYWLFGHNFDMFFIFVLSMLGGYPVGAKLINELYKEEKINKKTANILLLYCVNAGPSFVILVVGGSINSFKIGKLLLISHLFSSLIIAVLSGFVLRKHNCSYTIKKRSNKSFSSVFIESVAQASESVLNVCSFVIVFSVINSYLEYFLYDVPILKYISYFTEITSTVIHEKNIYFISFILGFSGISIWCQIISLTKNFKLNIPVFLLGRLLHATLSVIITICLVKLFNSSITTFSNNVSINKSILYSNEVLFISMFIMLLVLFVFIYSKNNSGKLIEDVV